MRGWGIRRGLALVLVAALAGCASNALKQARVADELRDVDLAVASYTKAVREHPNNQEAVQGLERARLRASENHLYAGRRLVAQGRYEDAQLELQIATELNPTNAAAETELQQVRVRIREKLSRPETGPTDLEARLERARTLSPAGYELPDATLTADISTGAQASSRTVYQMLARLGNLSVTFDSQFRDAPAAVNLRGGLTVRQALDAVAASTSTFYQVVGPSTIVVVPDTPAKRREYADEVVAQFVVQNADLKEVMDALRIAGDLRYVAPITGTNTLVVRDTPDRVQRVGRFLATFDKAPPEVVIDVELLEANRSTLREYGLQLASPGSPGIDGVADVNREGGITLQTLRNLSQADVLIGNIPALYYRLLKTDGRTRTLANTHVRVTDTKTATAGFGDQVPIPRTVIAPLAQGGINVQPQTSFEYKNIGVNISITPRTHANDDVSLALDISLTSVGAPGFDGLPTFGNRNVQTFIRLRDGETNILSGLIRQDERTERQTIPGLGSVPILGNLFSRDHKEALQTDVVLMLTPHIVRSLDVAEEDLRPLRMPREGGGPALIEPVYTPPPTTVVVPRPDVPPQSPGQPQPGQPAPNPGLPPAPPRPGGF